MPVWFRFLKKNCKKNVCRSFSLNGLRQLVQPEDFQWYSMTEKYWEFLPDFSQYFSSFIWNAWYWFDMLLVLPLQYYNVMVSIFVSHLYGVDYLPFNQSSTWFEQNYKIRWNLESSVYKKMLKKDNIVWNTFSDTETKELQIQQLYVIQALSYKYQDLNILWHKTTKINILLFNDN